MLRSLLILCLICSGLVITAQTKMLAHKSHSGTGENLGDALGSEFFNLGVSNFGAAPERSVSNAVLDSVIFVSDSVAIMVTSEVCSNSRSKKSVLWSMGKDTVFNHPLFSGFHTLDSIKAILKRQYFFKNNVDSIKFIGFNECQPVAVIKNEKDGKYAAIPLTTGGKGSSGNLTAAIIVVIAAFLIYAVLLINRFNTSRSPQPA